MAALMPPPRANWALGILLVTMATMSSTAEPAHSDDVPGHLAGAERLFAQSGADALAETSPGKTPLKGLRDGVYLSPGPPGSNTDASAETSPGKTPFKGLRDGVYFSPGSPGSNTDRYAPFSPYYSKMSTRDQHVIHYPDGSVYKLTSDGVLKPISGTLGGFMPFLNKPPLQQPLAPNQDAPPTVVIIKVSHTSSHRPPRPVFIPTPVYRPSHRPRPSPGGYASDYMNYVPGSSRPPRQKENWYNNIDFSKYPPMPLLHHHSNKPSGWWDDDDDDDDDDKHSNVPSHGWGLGGGGQTVSPHNYYPQGWPHGGGHNHYPPHWVYGAGGSTHLPEKHNHNNIYYPHGWPYGGNSGSFNYQYPPSWIHGGSKHPPGEEHHHTNYPMSLPFRGSNPGSYNNQYPPYWKNGSSGSKYPSQGYHNHNSNLYPPSWPYGGTSHPLGWGHGDVNSIHPSAPHLSIHTHPYHDRHDSLHDYPSVAPHTYPPRPNRPPWTAYNQYPTSPSWRPDGGRPFYPDRPQSKAKDETTRSKAENV